MASAWRRIMARPHSLTHVRYMPQASWMDDEGIRITKPDPNRLLSRQSYMIRDGTRYLPCLAGAEWLRSLYEVKTVLLKNELDDGRRIPFQRRPAESRVTSILGGKLDNICDLFGLLRSTDPRLAAADERFVRAGTGVERGAT